MKIRTEIKKYIEANIIPQYNHFDKAHNVEHVKNVIEKSIFLAERVGADVEMSFVIAAYHDVGLKVEREGHNIYSAEILESDKCLKKWFTDEQRHIMSQAVEDHSTSIGKEPRTIYGKIIYQADVALDAETVVKRSFLFGLEHFSELSFEEQIDRVYVYVNQKYGINGRFKIWIDIPEEKVRLQNIRGKLEDKDYIRATCLEINQLYK